ncbi:MAG: nuclear transport factor 2 family protein [Pseudomonadota bacterium]|nr:nuclear transport factor 2 family protein [Pseudomonadota bacterium]
MSDEDEIRAELLGANERFYAAFAGGDLRSMSALWAAHDRLACTHPGRPPSIGRARVLSGWFDILQNPPPVRCIAPVPMIIGAAGMVLCLEQVGQYHLAATNVFEREGRHWRMVHHHAGPVEFAPDPAPEGHSGQVH